MPIDLQKLQQKFDALFEDENTVTEFEQWLEARNVSQNDGKPIVMRSLPHDYWKRRCALAEQCLETSPCDPDITAEQCAAWAAYHSFIKEFGNDA